MEVAETPNTRSRRKRELERDTEIGSGLSWVHDQGLRKAILMATENECMELPAPTQKPRPISSRLAFSPSSASNTPSSSTNTLSSVRSSRPRKRPCRQYRSLPEASSSENGLGRSSSSSDSSGERLDALLARFALGPNLSPEKVRSTPTSISIPRSKEVRLNGSPLNALERNTLSAPSPLRRMTTSTESIRSERSTGTSSHRVPGLKGLSRSGSGGSIGSTDRSISVTSKPQINKLKTPSNTRIDSDISVLSPSPLSPSKQTGPAPRIGLRSSQSAKRGFPAQNPNKQDHSQKPLNKPFKPPLLQPPTRSSPRRRPSASTTPKKTPKTPRPSTRNHSPSKLSLKDTEGSMAPSSDGPTTGDESFDSFDGMFVDGGPEIEDLLRKLDGSQ